jgi:LysR family nitrogen assimilation transcriptional regulator
MKLRQLVCFCKVVDTGSFSAAADQLNMAQPALGSQIRQLENGLGTPLFVRHPRGVTPTAAGKLLSDEARAILGHVERVSKQIKMSASGERPRLRLGVCPSVIKVVGPKALIDTARSLPDVTVTIVEERSSILLNSFASGKLDIAFINNVREDPGIERTALLVEDLLFVTKPTGDTQPETIPLAKALEHELTVGGPNSVLRRIIEAEAQRLSLPLRIAYEFHSLTSIKDLVATGSTATIMSYGVVAEEIRAGKLAGQKIVSPSLSRTLYMVRPRDHDEFSGHPAIREFTRNILDIYLQIAQPWASRVA